MTSTPPAEDSSHGPDAVSIRRWVAVYAAYLLLAGVPLAILIWQQRWDWGDWRHDFQHTFAATSPAIKLLAMALYLSAATTFLPLQTSWLIACVATRQAAVGPNVWITTLAVALVAAIASTVGNLNDYHILTWMLRHHRLAKLRHTRLHARASAWFGRSPFA